MKFKIILLLFFLMLSNLTSGQKITLVAAINKAGKQRMICKRMAKDYMLIGAGINVKEATADLENSTALFNENYHDLMIFAQKENVLIDLDQVDVLWKDFRIDLLGKPSQSQALLIYKDANLLIKSCNQVVEKIQQINSRDLNNKLPNTSGKQRFNLQKIAELYVMKKWGIPLSDIDKQIKDTIGSFEICLVNLLLAPENTKEINDLLKLQSSEWESLKIIFSMNSNNSELQSILTKTDVMTNDFDKITSLYEKLIQK